MLKPLNSNSLYSNCGNASILQFIDESDRTILDIGCGAGDTGKLIRSVYPETHVTGITCSEAEYREAIQKLDYCICIDVERDVLPTLTYKNFDVLSFIHVLEHLVDPIAVIQKLLPYLKIGGKVIIALPNIANWRYRLQIALGKFEYTDGGVMDKTHLHFYTFYTAPQYLIEPVPQLKIEKCLVSGGLPLGSVLNKLVGSKTRQTLDKQSCRWNPNLFGYEILMLSKKII
ncbi:methyltransferase type 12 [Nostoc punctiforme NIES-2108]|uniref:Methyltransferase type 12 n=1 Tax=Nostoc punctiforme NIES-2108 TaxID=1356359 RepID=A0A367RHW3_NOSPU|nr:methyltransferase type 12 [Nostoc punctiforme NIES-2108]